VLPDVESVLNKANNKAHDFAEQARAMQANVELQQQKSRDALAAQKAAYEKRLSQQALQSDAIKANNTEIDSQNNALEKSNTVLFKELNGLQANNTKMRQALKTIDDKVAAAALFLADSLKVTDDSNAEELSVLAPTTPKPTLDHFLAVAGADRVSLLQLSSPRALSQGPEDLVNVLSKSLADIASAEVEGAAELKAHFLANFEDGQKQQAALNATQVQLMELQSELKAHQSKLLEAKAHLQATNKKLVERLHGLRVFARKVDSAAAGSLDTKTASQDKSPAAPAASTPAAVHTTPAPMSLKVAVAEVPRTKKLEAVKTAAPASAAPFSPKKHDEPKTSTLRHVKSDAKAHSPLAPKAANTEVTKAQELTNHRQKATSAFESSSPPPANKRSKKVIGLMQSSVSQKKKEEPSRWSTWFSALR